MTEQDLTQKILRDANRQAKSLIAAAEKQAAAQILAAEQNASDRKTAALQRGQADLRDRQTQQTRAHEVAQIKAKINAEQQQIDTAFAQAREKLLHASNQDIKRLVDTYTKKYAHQGDKILIAQAWSHALPDLSTTDAIAGGIIIENDNYRLELDVDSILATLREPLAVEIAKILEVM